MKYFPPWILALLLAITLVACGGEAGDAGPALGKLGDACAADSECESGKCLTQFGDEQPVQDGMCTSDCQLGDPQACGDDGVCLVYTRTGEQYCFLDCSGDGACRDGWMCLNLVTAQACVPPL